MIRSIRLKMVLWYMLILALTLCVFSALVYHYLQGTLYGELDELLASRVGGITDAIDMYEQKTKIGTLAHQPVVVGKREDTFYFTKIAKQWIEKESDHPQLLNVFIRIFDIQGKQVASSKNIRSILDLPHHVMNVIAQGGNYLDNIYLTSSAGELLSLRMLTQAVTKNGKIAYIVQVAAPMTPIDRTLRGLKKIFIFVLPLTVILTGVSGLFLASRALHPVDDMIRTIRQITAKNLHMRLSVPKSNDELHRLADTFNDMLVRLEESITLQKQFMHDISHELKTPLTILKGQLEVTLNKLRSPEEYEESLRSSLEEIDELSRLVENLLVLARFDSQKTALHLHQVSLDRLLEDAVAHIKILAQKKNITIDYPSHTVSVSVNADDDYLRRVFLNLLNNAISYTPEGGTIHVGVSKDGDFARVNISDNGIGISSQDLPHIFDRFYCADKSHKSHGLGLSIVQSVVNAHQGHIDVASTPGKGTTFTVSLPSASV